MFAAWVRAIGGKIKGDPRVSAEMTYNTFPWPEEPRPAAKSRVRSAAQDILDARSNNSAPLEVLYDPISMPPKLVAAHRKGDQAVDALYGRGTFDELRRVTRLFEKYQRATESRDLRPAVAS